MTNTILYNHPVLDDLVAHIQQVHQGHQTNLQQSQATLANLPEAMDGAGAQAAGQAHHALNAVYGQSGEAILACAHAVNMARQQMMEQDARCASQYT